MTKVIIKSDDNKEIEISTKLPAEKIKQLIEKLGKNKISEKAIDELY